MNTTTQSPSPQSRVIGWTEGDGSGHDGYHASDYFDERGRYLGPDQHGIEPIFEDAPQSPAAAGTAHTPTPPPSDKP